MKTIVTANFSGGRSSAYMVWRLLDEGMPVDHIIFCNTGLESPETYAFIEACNEQLFDGRLIMLEYGLRKGKRIERVADLNRDGQPMRELIEGRRLPNRQRRSCTAALKIETMFRHLYTLVPDYRDIHWESLVGLRADEPQRVARLKATNDLIEARINAGKRMLKYTALRYAPLAARGVTRSDVLAFFKSKPLSGLGFDPADERIRLSNCVGCFYGNNDYFIDTARRHRRFAEFWEEQETGIYQSGRTMKSDEARARRAINLRKLGIAEPDHYEREAYAVSDAPWKVYIKLADAGKEVQPDMIFEGGCESGECGIDV